jgi:transcriptional regulator of acetoin/glycerol metabolism
MPSPEDLLAQLREALEKHGGNISAVAREMGVARVQIHRWLERHSLNVEDFRKP